MKLITWITHQDYDIPLAKNHRFTSTKFSDLYFELKRLGLEQNAVIKKPSPATINDLLIIHEKEYIEKIYFGRLSEKEEKRIGLNWSQTLANRSFLAVNGTLMTARAALSNGIACHLAGGTHHAHANFGSGYCIFNDLAYASLALINTNEAKKILIFDCDVHQGDGTASILNTNDNIFTCSIHCKNNFPARKSQSNLDIPLDDGLDNKIYLKVVSMALQQCTTLFKPDLVLYDAGVDIHKNDKLGRLNVDDHGLLARDLKVLEYFQNLSIPIATVIGGGYSDNNKELARRHSTIFSAATQVFMN